MGRSSRAWLVRINVRYTFSNRTIRYHHAALVNLDVNHPAIHRVDGEIFKVTFVSDCIQHRCLCRDENDRSRNDACCQYGADLLLPEKNAILRRAPEIASVLRPHLKDAGRWFDEREPGFDPDAPGGVVIRTATSDPDEETSGCVFLEHTGERGCGLHHAALLNGFEPAEVKPSACRLYPLSWDSRWLGLSPDFNSYSCAHDGGPTVYRLMRQVIGEIFDLGLVRELDRLESQVLRRRLPVKMRMAP
jgi:Fe-S-cluster containining protein